MLDEETAKLMMETNTSICLQPFYDDEDAIPHEPGSFQEAKYEAMISGTDTAFALAKNHNLLFGFGTDTQFMPALAARQGAQLAKLVPLLRALGSAEDCDQPELRDLQAFRAARSLSRSATVWFGRVPMPTCFWSTAIRSRTST